MNFEDFEAAVECYREGCLNRLGDMEPGDSVEDYNWYAEAHNELSGTFMALQIEYYDDETSDN